MQEWKNNYVVINFHLISSGKFLNVKQDCENFSHFGMFCGKLTEHAFLSKNFHQHKTSCILHTQSMIDIKTLHFAPNIRFKNSSYFFIQIHIFLAEDKKDQKDQKNNNNPHTHMKSKALMFPLLCRNKKVSWCIMMLFVIGDEVGKSRFGASSGNYRSVVECVLCTQKVQI